MGPFTLKWYEAARKKRLSGVVGKLEIAQHFLISKEIETAARDLVLPGLWAAAEETDDGQFRLGNYLLDFLLPANVFVFETSNGAVLFRQSGGWLALSIPGADNACVVPLQGPLGEAKFSAEVSGDGVMQDLMLTLVIAESICALLMEPRIVQKGRPGAKDRERARWKLGASRVPVAWHQVTWTISAPTTAKSDASEAAYRMPLHYTRAHLRKAEEHHPKSRRVKGKDGWWTVVRGHWRGHPDFGVKLHHYTPRLGRGDPGYTPGEGANTADARIATGGAVAAALGQLGAA